MTHAHTRLKALYALATTLLIGIWSLVPTSQAHAYVDPSVMTYTIQAVAGLAVALSAVIGVVFRRTRRKLYQLLKVDENAHKVAETDIERINPQAAGATERKTNADAAAQALLHHRDEYLTDGPRTMSWRTRFLFALVICVFMAFIVFIAPALEIYGSNGDSLVFGLATVWWIPVVFCLAGALIAALAISFLQGRPFYIALALIFALTIAAYVQSLFLNQGMLPADGGFIGWDEPFFVGKKISSGLIWLAIIAATLVLVNLFSHNTLKVSTGLACAIMVVQLVGVISVAIDASKTSVEEASKPYVTQGSLLSVSPKNNVIEFVLDTYDTAILETIRKEDPHFLEDFADFTYFPNSTGTMIPTTNAIPNMLTAQKPQPGEDLDEYRRTKYERSTFMRDIYDLGYSLGIYSDSLMMDFSNPADRAITELTLNVHPVSRAPLDVWQTFIAMEQCALYRESLWLLKPIFWYYTSDLNNRMIADSDDISLNDSLYELDDAAILNLLRQQGLSVQDDAEQGAFRFIHLFGPHFPFSINEDGENIGTNQSDQIAQAKGSMKVVSEYLSQLKELELYDSATVIITADHGVWSITEDPVQNPISPIILVKPAKQNQAAQDSEAPAQTLPAQASAAQTPPAQSSAVQTLPTISDMPVGHDDLQPTIIAAMNGDYAKYGTPIFEINDPERIRYFDALTNVGDEGQKFIEYAITGDVLDIRNWEKTGNVWYGA